MSKDDQRLNERERRSDRPALRIGDWVLHADLGLLRGPVDEVRLNPKSLQVLLVLIDAGTRGVSRDELLAAVWKESYPSDAVVSRAIADLRAAFGEKAGDQRYLRTLPKFGYQLVAEVTQLDQRADVAAPQAAKIGIPKVWMLRLGLWSAASVSAILLGAIWLHGGGLPQRTAAIELIETQPLTVGTGLEHQPRFSPSDDWVVYAVRDHGRDDWDLYRRHLVDGTPLPVAVEAGISEHGPAFAPDGKRLAFVRIDHSDRCEVVVQELATGAAESVAACTTRFPTLVDWAPDGQHLAFSASAADDREGRRRIHQLRLADGSRRVLTDAVSTSGTDYYPRYAPSGRYLVFLRGEPQPDHRSSLWMVDLSSATERQLHPAASMGGMSWLDEEHLVFAVHEYGQWTLYRLGAHDGELQRVSAPALIQPDVLPGSDRLAAALIQRRLGLMLIDGQVGPAATGKIQNSRAVVESTATDYWGRLSPDSRSLAFISTRSGHSELWVARLDQPEARQLTRFEGPEVRFPDWHPGGEELLFTVQSPTGERLHRVQLLTGRISRFGPDLDVTAARWLPDGERWVADCQKPTGWQLCIGDALGADALVDALFRPQPLDQSSVAAVDDHGVLRRVDVGNGNVSLLWEGLPARGRYAWELAGDTLYYLRLAGASGEVQLVSRRLESGFESVQFQGDLPITDTTISVSSDGSQIVLTGFRAYSDDIRIFRLANAPQEAPDRQ